MTAFLIDRDNPGLSIGKTEDKMGIRGSEVSEQAAKLLIYEAADLRERGEDVTTVAAMAKLYAGEAACYITDLSLQIHGGYGYMKDYAIERMYKDARITRIYEGTSEVQKMVISRNIINKY